LDRWFLYEPRGDPLERIGSPCKKVILFPKTGAKCPESAILPHLRACLFGLSMVEYQQCMYNDVGFGCKIKGRPDLQSLGGFFVLSIYSSDIAPIKEYVE
jgi:hypothetical protein